MRHGFIRPPLHFTPIPFAPYYSHLTVREHAWPRAFVYFALSCFTSSPRACEREEWRTWARRGEKDEGRKGRERHVHMIQPLHLMQVPFAPYCLSHCWKQKKVGDLPSLKRQLIPSPLAWAFVYLFVCALCVCQGVCASVQHIHLGSHSCCLCAVTHLWV